MWPETQGSQVLVAQRRATRLYQLCQGKRGSLRRAGNEIDTCGPLEYNLDQVNPGKLLFPLYERTGDDRHRKAANHLMERLKSQPRTCEGGFWYKEIYVYRM